MKIINKVDGAVVAEIITNHAVTLDEAVELAGGKFIEVQNPWDEDVKINGELYFTEDLEIV